MQTVSVVSGKAGVGRTRYILAKALDKLLDTNSSVVIISDEYTPQTIKDKLSDSLYSVPEMSGNLHTSFVDRGSAVEELKQKISDLSLEGDVHLFIDVHKKVYLDAILQHVAKLETNNKVSVMLSRQLHHSTTQEGVVEEQKPLPTFQ